MRLHRNESAPTEPNHRKNGPNQRTMLRKIFCILRISEVLTDVRRIIDTNNEYMW